VASFAVASLSNPAAINSIMDLGGPEALSPLEAVRIFEEKSGNHSRLEYIPEEALRTQYQVSTDPLQKSFAALMLKLISGDIIDRNATLRSFPVHLTSVRDYCNLVSGKEEKTPLEA
jgi:NADH dehydrogenase